MIGRAPVYENAGTGRSNIFKILGYTITSKGDLAGQWPMRDWIIVLGPFAAPIYFLVYPDQLRQLVAWLTILIQ
jgi:hypothetical protein